MLAQIGNVILLPFLKTAFRDSPKFQFRCVADAGINTTLRNILHAGTGGLHHLVMDSALILHVLITKPDGKIINNFRYLINGQVSVTAMFGNKKRSPLVHPAAKKPVVPENHGLMINLNKSYACSRAAWAAARRAVGTR